MQPLPTRCPIVALLDLETRVVPSSLLPTSSSFAEPSTDALFPLYRGLSLTLRALQHMQRDREAELHVCFSRSYDEVLRHHHSFVIRGVVTVGIYYLFAIRSTRRSAQCAMSTGEWMFGDADVSLACIPLVHRLCTFWSPFVLSGCFVRTLVEHGVLHTCSLVLPEYSHCDPFVPFVLPWCPCCSYACYPVLCSSSPRAPVVTLLLLSLNRD